MFSNKQNMTDVLPFEYKTVFIYKNLDIRYAPADCVLDCVLETRLVENLNCI
jgi:hypothetical protein